IVEAFGICSIEVPGCEADDVLATIARRAEQQGSDVVIVTGDRDTLQLVSDRVAVLATLRGISDTRRYTPERVQEEYGVPPARLPDLRGLTGEPSDNIPGIPGIGPKTARQLLEEFGDLDSLLERAHEIRNPRIRELVKQHAESARLSRELATLKTNVEADFDLDEARVTSLRPAQARRLLSRLEFRSLLSQLPRGEDDWDGEYRLVSSEVDLDALCDELEAAHHIALAVCASEGAATRADVHGLAVATGPQAAAFVPARFLLPDGDSATNLFDGHGDGGAGARLRAILRNEDVPKYGHDLKRTGVALGRRGVPVRGLAFDAMIASYAMAPHRSDHGMDQLVSERLAMSLPAPPRRKKKSKPEEASGELTSADGLDLVQRRTCAEADAALRLVPILEESLRRSGATALFADIEMPLVSVLMEMELAGVAIDVERLRQLGAQMSARIDELAARIHELAGRPFNIDSPKQLAVVLFEELRLPGARRTKTGYSTDADTLAALAGEHEIAREILEYRSFAKLKSTYVDGLLKLADPDTGRIHTTLNQTVVATGRLSSSEPNLQNIPIRTEWGREIRACFIAGRDDWRLIAADYSQIELRVLAHLSRDPNLMEAFRLGEDVHARTAAQIFEVPVADVTPEMRRQAKTVNFAVIYGMGPAALATELGITREDAQSFISNYFAKLPGVKSYIDGALRQAREDGCVTTLLGRRREMPGLASRNPGVRSYAERAAVNHPIQGTAADIIKIAMVRLARRLADEGLQARMVLQVHDELLLEAPQDQVQEAARLTHECMHDAYRLSVPLTVQLEVGDNWRDMEPIVL
ncbi:MAG: DNA polymerase I, partial [Armatimonadota bacterium]